jgi:hypothetical protein
MKIKFKKELDLVSDFYIPKPATSFLPDWYKNMPTYINIKEIPKKPTIKKCIPVFDAMTAGYIITTWTDIIVEIKEENGIRFPYFHWSSSTPQTKPIEFHELEQVANYPFKQQIASAPKFMNAWSISTPPGYSCLFINPMHNTSKNFRILEGIVDTDKSTIAVNFPFILTNLEFEGLIPAGTPIAQVIPFKRDKWEHEIDFEFIDLNKKDVFKTIRSVFVHGYKNFLWTRKEFK